MSSTRKAPPGSPLNQSKFSSSAEFNRGIVANLCARRCSLIEDQASRELVWFVQYLSHQPGGLEKLAGELIEKFGHRMGTRQMLKLGIEQDQTCSAQVVKKIRLDFLGADPSVEFPLNGEANNSIFDTLGDWPNKNGSCSAGAAHPSSYPATVFWDICRNEMSVHSLSRWLAEWCLDPALPTDSGPWYFHALVDCLREYQAAWQVAQDQGKVVTELGNLVNETLDYVITTGAMAVIDGLARTGKSYSAKAFCTLNGGRIRFAEVPSTNDDIGFFRAIAAPLGIPCGLRTKAVELRQRIEQTLLEGHLALALDEAHRLWPNVIDARCMPNRINWIMEMVNKGAAICLITTPQFMRNQRALEERTRWTSEQFTGRIGHYQKLPGSLSENDLARVARAALPEGCEKSIKALILYAQGSAKYMAGLDAAVRRARYLAGKAGRSEVIFADIKAAIKESVIPSDAALAQALESTPNRRRRGWGASAAQRIESGDLETQPTPRLGIASDEPAADSLDQPGLGRRTRQPAGMEMQTPARAARGQVEPVLIAD